MRPVIYVINARSLVYNLKNGFLSPIFGAYSYLGACLDLGSHHIRSGPRLAVTHRMAPQVTGPFVHHGIQVEKSPFASAKISAALAMLRQSLAPVRLGSVPALNTLQKKSFLPACRPYSVAAHPISDLNASTVTVENASSPKNLTPSEKLVFGHTFTGEFYCDWD